MKILNYIKALFVKKKYVAVISLVIGIGVVLMMQIYVQKDVV